MAEKSLPKSDSRYTEKQGQYLAFIHYYTKINGYPPAEAHMQRFFNVSVPSVHRVLLDLEKKTLISRTPRLAIRIQLLPRELSELV